jgi:hypothetical protein
VVGNKSAALSEVAHQFLGAPKKQGKRSIVIRSQSIAFNDNAGVSVQLIARDAYCKNIIWTF